MPTSLCHRVRSILRPLAALLLGVAALVVTPSLPAAEELDTEEILAAARKASTRYQRHVAELLRDLAAGTQEERVQTIRSFARLQEPRAVPVLVPLLDADVHNPEVVKAAALALADLGAQEAVAGLNTLAQRREEDLRLTALNALGQLRRLGPMDYRRAAAAEKESVRATGVIRIGEEAIEDAGDLLVRALAEDSRKHIRRMAAISLGDLGNAAYGPQLADALTDPDPLVRRYAAQSLARLDYRQAIPHLLMALEANIASGPINRSLMILSGEDFGFHPHANVLERQEAVRKGFAWWTEHAEEIGR